MGREGVRRPPGSGVRRWANRALSWRRRREALQAVECMRPYLPRRGRVLDIGCGLGHVGGLLDDGRALRAVGCDIVPRNAALRRFVLFDGRLLPFGDAAFDAAILAFVLHHAADPVRLLRDASRVASGAVLVLEDTPRSLAERVYARLHVRSFDGANGIRARGRVRGEAEWREIFGSVGCRLVASRGLGRLERWPPVARTLFILEPGATPTDG